MVFSELLIKLPYTIFWNLFHDRDKKKLYIYVGEMIDYIVMRNVVKHLNLSICWVAKNRTIQKRLAEHGIKAKPYPVFPQAVLMARHALHKFPVKKIKKIGMTHGAYNFKKLISASKYNAFDIYFFTSINKLKEAQELGVKTGKAIGYSKLDPAFSGEKFELENYKKKLRLDDSLPTIIFSATWDKKGYAAIDLWYKRIRELADDYNVMVTLHPWTSKHKVDAIKKTKGIKFIEDENILPYLMIADLMIGDTSSIIGEFCALDKPIITFKLPLTGRMTEEVENMLQEISFRVENFDDLKKTIPIALQNPHKHKDKRSFYNKIMFDELDGKAGLRAAQTIQKFIEKHI